MTSSRPAVARAVTTAPGARAAGSARRFHARTTTGRVRPLATGLAAVVALAAVVVGLPVVLYHFSGSPIPRHVAGWHRLVTLVTSRDNSVLLVGIVRDLSWLAWLLFAGAVLAEVQAALRGRAAPQLRLGGLQGTASRLVALTALAFSTPNIVPVAASAAVVAPVRVDATASTASGAVEAAARRVVVVRSGDCLWSIAQRDLGAGDLYPEIARLNYGRQMDDGQVFTNPSVIEPGWHLLLPATGDAASRDSSAAHATAVGAGHHLGHPTRDPQFRRRHPTATSRATSPAASNPDGRASQTDNEKTEIVSTPVDEDMRQAMMFAAGSVAGAVLSSLTRLRARQRQHRLPGRRIALPADPEVLAAEQRLYASAPVAAMSTLQGALGYLETGFADPRRVIPDIVGLHVTPAALEVLLGAPAQTAPPDPFVTSPGRQGMCWHLALSAESAEQGATSAGSGLLPGLFTAGSTDDGYLLLNLESLQVSGCDGPPELVERVLTTVGTELATRQWSGWYDLVLVGFDELDVLGRAEHCANLDEALTVLDARGRALRRRLASEPPTDIRQLRLAEPEDEDWVLTILVSRAEPSPDQLTHLLELAEDGLGGIAALVAGDPETADGRMAATVLQLAPDPQRPGEMLANVAPLQITIRPQALTDSQYQAISTLFATAADTNDMSPQQPPYEMYSAPPWIPQAAALAADPADGSAAAAADAITSTADEVAFPPQAGSERPASLPVAQALTVKVLGPLVITGAVEQLQPKHAELVVALALAAPGGLSNSALASMLGADPDHPKPSDAVRQIIARARRRLGPARDGREYIMHTGSGMYLLHPDASLDWTEFRNLIAGSRADDMRAALAMVRGEPFAGSYYWWIDIPLLEAVRAEIVDAALSLAEFELASGSPRAAARAARAGLAAEVSAEQLWRLLMRAEHAARNPAGIAEAWRHCLDAIEDIAPGGEPHPDTAALYRQLTMTAARQDAELPT